MKHKPSPKELAFNIIIAILLILTSFGLGQLYAKPRNETQAKIEIKDPPPGFEEQFVKKEKDNTSKKEITANSPETDSKPFVASKNGTRYYPKNCSAASRIKEENKVYFETEEEAQTKNLTRTVSKSCDNLWPQ